MANLNKVFLMGRLTRDPELRYTPGGAAVTDLSVAINRTFSTRDGESREETVFVEITVWDRQAETCCQYLKKGRAVHVEGSLKMDSWDDKATGEKRSKLKVQADRVQFLDRRDEAGGAGYEDLPAPASATAPSAQRDAPPSAPRRPPTESRGADAPASNGNGSGNGPSRGFSGPSASAPPRRPMPEPEPGGDDDDIPF